MHDPTALGAGPGHWEAVHRLRGPEELTWFQPVPRISLELIGLTGITHGDRIIDVGAGSSRLCDRLLADGYQDVTVLDISATALAHVADRTGDCPELLLIEGDVGSFRSGQPFDLWHDRAVFHFLVERDEREAYLESLRTNLRPTGHVIISTFGPRGPDTCSGLPVRKYSAGDLSAELGDSYRAVEFREELHETPRGGTQHFLYGLFERTG
jgi:SAM-dependent methyltransferase